MQLSGGILSLIKHFRVWQASLAAFLLLGVYAAPATAQTSPTAPAPMFNNVDANGVDITTGQFRFSLTEGTIGSGPGAVTLARFWGDGVWRDNWSGGLYSIGSGSSSITYIDFGGVSDSFTLSGGTYTTREGNGSTLVYDSGTQTYIYTTAAHAIYVFQSQQSGKYLAGQICPAGANNCNRPISITEPTGLVWTINWDEAEKCFGGGGGDCTTKFYYRFSGVSSSAGYGFGISYQNNDPGAVNVVPPADWYVRTGASFGSTAGSCSGVCPAMAYSTTTPLSLTDTLGRVWRFTMTGSNLTGIKRPGSASADTTTITYTSGKVSQIVRDGITTNYAYSTTSGVLTTTATDANSNTVQIETATSVGRPRKVTDQLSRVTQQTYDSSYRPSLTTWPEGNTLTRAYDARGNVTSTTLAPKPGSSLSNIVTSATFANTCPGAACNKPDTTTDARSHVTNYYYDTTTGQLTSMKAPAPASGGVRPETRYSYAATAGVSMPVTISACRTTSSCTGGADEVKTTISYNGNLLPSTVTSGGGDGVLTASASFTYDAAGNQTYADGPLTGTADTTRTLYDQDREVIGTIGPDPDGGGALKNRATRLTYNADGQVTLAEQGTTLGQTNSNWSAFAPLQSVATAYDANARKTSDASVGGSTTYAVNQYSYDVLGRPECAAQRMNSAAWGSLPSSACTLQTAGSFGSDRINKTTYDAASQVIKTTSALGVAGTEADDATLTYTSNGKAQTLVDANSNKTTYEYDGFDRLDKQRYPSPTTPGTSSTTDYVQPTYDVTSNVTSTRLRDGQTIGASYDDLNRRTLLDLSGSGIDYDITYTYDNLGHLLTSADTPGRISYFQWDALGRAIAERTTYAGASTYYQYDLAGRRTRLTWPDGNYTSYDRLVTGEVSTIGLNGGATPLATYIYDDLGRRMSLTRANGAVTTWGYDAISRLTSLSHDLPGTANDLTIGLSYNPANQIVTRTSSNDSYSYALANQDLTEAPNGLNQLVTQGAASLSYDGRGNLIAAYSSSYYYSQRDLLYYTAPYGLFYDPLGRLEAMYNYTTADGSLLNWGGNDLLSEASYATGNMLRRWVPGPGGDEPLVQYEGGGFGDRRWLYQDERGSVIATQNDAGTTTTLNRYDDYGTPASGNAGRFGYTGQLWLPEIGLNYYKARMYAPGLGRFMQSDPIGYAGGINFYAYVGGDPVNGSDPSGLIQTPDCTGTLICRYDSSDGSTIISGGGSNAITSEYVSGGGGQRRDPKDESNTIIVTAIRQISPSFLSDGLSLGTLPEGAVLTTGQDSTNGFQNAAFNVHCPPGLLSPCARYEPVALAYRKIATTHFGQFENKSSFLPSLRNYESIDILYRRAQLQSIPVPYGNSPGVYSLTAVANNPVGFYGYKETRVYTFTLFLSGKDSDGLNVYTPSNGFPGPPQ